MSFVIFQNAGSMYLVEVSDIILLKTNLLHTPTSKLCRVELIDRSLPLLDFGEPRYAELRETDENLDPYSASFRNFKQELVARTHFQCESPIMTEMVKVYFDKNVLSHIISAQRGAAETNRVSPDDVKSLLSAVGDGKVMNLLSVMHLQEASYALRASSPSIAQDELKLLKGLMNTREIIEFPSDLLKDDITAYSEGRELSSPLIANPLNLDELFSDKGDIAERKKVLDDTDQYNAEFLTLTSKAKLNDLEYVLAEFGGKQPTFEEFYNKKINELVVELVSRTEEETGKTGLLDACKSKGIEQMLQVPSVALAEGTSLSYQYARVFEEMSEKKRKRLGDASDLNHALLASAADVLVTHDQDFASWVDRIPNKPFKVLDHVQKLIQSLA